MTASLAFLIRRRIAFRLGRLCDRTGSPRRIVASILSVGSLIGYFAIGLLILSTRPPADPARLQMWLSGGMVLYLIYHSVRRVFATDQGEPLRPPAEALWLGGGPLRPSTLAVYRLGQCVTTTAVKTVLMAVVLMVDVPHLWLLLIGLFAALLLLEICRAIIDRVVAGLSPSERRRSRIAIVAVAVAIGLQFVAHVLTMVSWGSQPPVYLAAAFASIGQVAECSFVQAFAAPWWSASSIVTAEHFDWSVVTRLLASLTMLPLAMMGYVVIDRWARDRSRQLERARYESGHYRSADKPRFNGNDRPTRRFGQSFAAWAPANWSSAITIAARGGVSLSRHRGSVLGSFILPVLLCLSPILAGGLQVRWLFVVGGVAFCTLMLAPPALRIDFRRDLRRMPLLKAMPVSPLAMVVGQITPAVLVTWAFQAFVLVVGGLTLQPGWPSWCLWSGALSALAVLAFGLENALFLAYPHHEHARGVGVLVRAKLSFLGKSALLTIAVAGMVTWAVLVRECLPGRFAAVAAPAGVTLMAWSLAATSVSCVVWCWRRFDLATDVPPM